MKYRNLLLLVGGALCLGTTSARGGQPVQLEWKDLGARITHRKVAFVLPDGTHVEGKVREVRQDGLSMDVSKSSNRNAQPKGRQLIKREALSLLSVTGYGRRGRLIGTLGGMAAAGAIAAATYPDIYEGPAIIIVPAVVAGGIAGSGVAGYFIGKRIDRRVVEIRILPDPAGGSSR